MSLDGTVFADYDGTGAVLFVRFGHGPKVTPGWSTPIYDTVVRDLGDPS